MELMDRVRWACQRAWLGRVIALLTAGAAIGTRVLLGRALEGFPFITFFPAILISAVFADYFLLEPHGWGLSWPSGWIGMISFIAVAAVMIVLMELAFRARERVTATADLLQRLNEQLEERVQERTLALQSEGNARGR